jgi:perosamine synthetase
MSIPLHEPDLGEEEVESVRQVMQSGWISSQGPAVNEFESMIEGFLGMNHCTAVDSGTAALQLALQSLGIGQGDKVAIPSFTFGATAMAVRNTGAEPVLVRIERERFGMDPARLEKRLSSLELDAVLVVHLFGRPARIEEIQGVADSHDVPVVEDAAQVLGTEFKGRKLGSFGDVAAFSFSWNKTVTTAKGGAVVTDREELCEKIDGMASQGKRDRKFEMEEGFNYRMDSIRAGLGTSQMERFYEVIERKKEIVDMYRENLSDVEEIEIMEGVEEAEIAPWMFFITSGRREDVQKALEKEEIGFRRFYRPVGSLDSFESSGSFPVSTELREEGLMLPTYPGMSSGDVEKVSSAIRDAVR